ncbi:hypothetical protein GOPIP_031_03350 [Gordonia polyisoprenivorans NBRC 16320 = JCM 10675]|nr:hypothetical protein GOPIP_031_03350 [Gordonia polyisoprenivorans NBRC 16320 = JCM 10675]
MCAGIASIDCIAVKPMWGMAMGTVTIRDLDDDLKALLRVRAAEHGRSMEAEVRAILRDVLTRPDDGIGMGTRIRRRFSGADIDGVEMPPRNESPRAPDLT